MGHRARGVLELKKGGANWCTARARNDSRAGRGMLDTARARTCEWIEVALPKPRCIYTEQTFSVGRVRGCGHSMQRIQGVPYSWPANL